MKNWYCKPASEVEAIEIVKRAVVNGAILIDGVSGTGGVEFKYDWNEWACWGCLSGQTHTGAVKSWSGEQVEQLTIQQVREQFPLPGEAKKPDTWQGPQDGFPPVGTVCEVFYADNKWHKTFIVGMDSSGHAVFEVHGFTDHAYDGVTDPMLFRPLRTEREVWVEDAISTTNTIGASSVIERIYDALKSGALKSPEVE